MIGAIGNIGIVSAFVCGLCAVVMFLKAAIQGRSSLARSARFFFSLQSISISIAVASLFGILYTHDYQYHYAWAHSASDLPFYYILSAFWEGQEGSFLVWIFFNSVLGFFLFKYTRESLGKYAMAVFAFVQTAMVILLLPFTIGDFTIGASPFLLITDKLDVTEIPTDGAGLNPLLQNIWMVIHPPTIFMGFALALIPFSLAMGALLNGNYKEWIKVALPWTLICTLVLTAGIVMGAYWAYETLNFGGYWNWDPVENAIYVPWIMWIAVVHLMILKDKSEKILRPVFFLTILSYGLIIYSTFLTRSGILGDSSVHSFTDSGLFVQLLSFLVVVFLGAVFLLAKKWNHIPSGIAEEKLNTAPFWLLLGVLLLCISSFQVLLATSIPVFNAIGLLFDMDWNFAPPVDAISYYTNFQYYVALAFCGLSVIAQMTYWKKSHEKIGSNLLYPIGIALLLTSLFVLIGNITEIKYILLLFMAVFVVTSTAFMIYRLALVKYRLTGGTIAHAGMALAILGILFSSAYSNTVSTTASKVEIGEYAKNKLLMRNESYRLGAFEVFYRGASLQEKSGKYISKDNLLPAHKKNVYYVKNDDANFKSGDTVACDRFNIFYHLDYVKNDSTLFALYPRIQLNPKMGVMASPAIKSSLFGDIYTHISNFPNPMEKEYSFGKTMSLATNTSDTIK